MTESRLLRTIRNKNVVFITVKNRDYIRVSQIERILKDNAKAFRIYSSEKGNPLTRAIDLNLRLGKMDFQDADVVILGFLPQLIFSGVMKRLKLNAFNEKGKPVIISEFFLSLYDTIVLDRKLIPVNFPLARWLKRLDKRALENSDLIVTDTGADADYFSRIYDVSVEKMEVLYLEADKSIYGRKADGTNESSFKSMSALYFGTGLPLQGTDVVLRAFSYVAKERPDFKCIFIGSLKGVPQELKDTARSFSNIEIIDWLPQNELADRIRDSGLCLAGHFNPDIDKANRTIPGKAYIYEAMGKPMILGDTKANHELFKEDERHCFVPRGDARKLAECIVKWAYHS